MFWEDESSSDGGTVSLAAIRSWVDEMSDRGIRLDGSSLSYAALARIVRVRDGDLLVSDGPYAETKEQVGGYDVIECADLDTAIEIAAAHPLASTATVEVRSLGDFPGEE